MHQLQKRSSDRSIIKRPRPATTLAVYLRQLKELRSLSGLTCYEAEFSATELAMPRKLNKGQVRVLSDIHRKHPGLSWHDEFECFETDGGVFAL